MDFKSEKAALTNAIHRCHNPRCNAYGNYGARGIEVCKEWRDGPDRFALFLEHIGPKPAPDYTLDRIDNNGNYEPGNVRWATRKEQSNNRRIPPCPVREVAANLEMPLTTAMARVKRGIPLNDPYKRAHRLTRDIALAIIKSEGSYADVGRRFGVTRATARRIKLGHLWGELQTK